MATTRDWKKQFTRKHSSTPTLQILDLFFKNSSWPVSERNVQFHSGCILIFRKYMLQNINYI